jgi:hypothetical protein
MASGRPAEWRTKDVTIREFFNLDIGGAAASEARAPSAGEAGGSFGEAAKRPGHIAVLLSHASFRRMFESVSADTYVSVVVVACYFGVPKAILERQLALHFGNGRPWRPALAERRTSGSGAPASTVSKLLWSFVLNELEPVLDGAVADAALKRSEKMRAVRRKIRGRPVPLLRLGDVIDSTLFVVDGRARIVGGLGQGHISAEAFIDLMDAGGKIESMSAVTALGRPWTSSGARLPWEEAVRASLAQATGLIDGMLRRGAVATG